MKLLQKAGAMVSLTLAAARIFRLPLVLENRGFRWLIA